MLSVDVPLSIVVAISITSTFANNCVSINEENLSEPNTYGRPKKRSYVDKKMISVILFIFLMKFPSFVCDQDFHNDLMDKLFIDEHDSDAND
jgi:hypothetical protein